VLRRKLSGALEVNVARGNELAAFDFGKVLRVPVGHPACADDRQAYNIRFWCLIHNA